MWQFNSNVSGTHHENIDLLQNPKSNEVSMRTDFSGILEYSTPTTAINAKPTIILNRYSDKSRDSIDRSLTTSFSYTTEKSVFNFSTDTKRDTSYSSELTTTGYIDKKKNRKSDLYSPSLTYYIDEFSSIFLSHSFTDVDYINGVSAGLFDYRYKNNRISYSRYTNSVGSVRVTYADISQDIDLLTNKYQTKSLSLGISDKLSQTLSYSADVGISRYKTSIGYANFNSSDRGWVTDLSIAKQYSQSNLKIGASKNVTPSGGGYMILRNQLNLDYKYQLTEHITTNFYGTALKNTRKSEAGTFNRYYGSADIGLNYNFESNWNISFHIKHRKNHSEEGIPAKDNMIMFKVSYFGQKTPIKNVNGNTDF